MFTLNLTGGEGDVAVGQLHEPHGEPRDDHLQAGRGHQGQPQHSGAPFNRNTFILTLA